MKKKNRNHQTPSAAYQTFQKPSSVLATRLHNEIRHGCPHMGQIISISRANPLLDKPLHSYPSCFSPAPTFTED